MYLLDVHDFQVFYALGVLEKNSGGNIFINMLAASTIRIYWGWTADGNFV